MSERIVIVTTMQTMPPCCKQCKYYDPDRYRRGWTGGEESNNGVCMAVLKRTNKIMVTKERLENCPLVMEKEKE